MFGINNWIFPLLNCPIKTACIGGNYQKRISITYYKEFLSEYLIYPIAQHRLHAFIFC